MSKKTTSLATLTEALTQHGWTFETQETEVSVPDYDSPDVRHSYSGRARYVPSKRVPGFAVTASNGIEESGYISNSKNFTALFTEDGKYLSQHTKGSYPFNMKGITLRKVLAQIESHSPQAVAERQTSQAEQEAKRLAEQDAKVLAAHTEAQEALVAAQHEAFNMLAEDAGLSTAQAEAVLVMLQTGKFGPVLNALSQVERTGKGWLPGESWVSGTYVDGVRVPD